ncbi:RPN6-N domain-containing protein [Mycena venus]|uniref:RPN6-N domain-containing protein n=1 Tax=Mycena venus TaxID=2733690 RepID=A0A8H7CR14_9AGAR|nr:RPN6-N domain-containing protein [Mycena venus]
MPLPVYVSERFALFDRTTSDGSEWYGPINTLLGYLFPPEQYEIAPQYKGPVYPGSIDFTTFYIVCFIHGNTKHPISFIEIKPAGHIHEKAARATADRQMRERFDRPIEGLVIPKLIGLSAIGSRFAVYEYDKASKELSPPEIVRDPRIVNDTAPAERWAHDFLDAGVGEVKLLEVVRSIRTMCHAL